MQAIGSSTTTMTGFGSSPCQEGAFTDPVTTNGSTGPNDSKNRCLPDSLKAPRGYLPFREGEQSSDGPEATTIRVSGSLKYKKNGK